MKKRIIALIKSIIVFVGIIALALAIIPDTVYNEITILRWIFTHITDIYSRADLRIGLCSIVVSTYVAISLFIIQENTQNRIRRNSNDKIRRHLGTLIYADIMRYFNAYCLGDNSYNSDNEIDSGYDYFLQNEIALKEILDKDFQVVEDFVTTKLAPNGTMDFEKHFAAEWINPVLRYGCFNYVLPRANNIYSFLSDHVLEVLKILGRYHARISDCSENVMDKAGGKLINKNEETYLIYDNNKILANCIFKIEDNKRVIIERGYVSTENYIGYVVDGKKEGDGISFFNGKEIMKGKFESDELQNGVIYKCIINKDNKPEGNYEQIKGQPSVVWKKLVNESFRDYIIGDVIIIDGKIKNIFHYMTLYEYIHKNDKKLLAQSSENYEMDKILRDNRIVMMQRDIANIKEGLVFCKGEGWDNSSGEWIYLRNGQMVVNEWKPANGHWFYLGMDGRIITNSIIEDVSGSEARYYCVDEYGAMKINKWVIAKNDKTDDNMLYYFGEEGKAQTSGTRKYDETNEIMGFRRDGQAFVME